MIRESRRSHPFTQELIEQAQCHLAHIFQRIWDGEAGLECWYPEPGHRFPLYRIRRFGENQLAFHEIDVFGGQGSGIYLQRKVGVPIYVARIHLRSVWDGEKMCPVEYRSIPSLQPAFRQLQVIEGDAMALMQADSFAGTARDLYDAQNIPEGK